MRVTAETKVATEKAIRAAARRLFAKRGLHGTSTRDIAEAARIATGTLFNYFPSKEALAISIVSEAFATGRESGLVRMSEARGETNPRSLEEDLFTLVAADIRALEPSRSFAAETIEAALTPFATGALSSDAAEIRARRLEDASAALMRHGLAGAVTPTVLHLYWSLYLGVLSYWSSDRSPRQEDTWALLDQSVRMFAGALRRDVGGPHPTPIASSGESSPSPDGAPPPRHRGVQP